MKRPDKVMGFLSYKDKQYPFICLEDTLQLLPPDEKTQGENSPSLIDSLMRTTECDKFVETLKMDGITDDGRAIYFQVNDFPSNQHGFISFTINYYFIYDQQYMRPDHIDGFFLRGQEVDCFYPPRRAIEAKVDEKRDENHPFGVSVTGRVLDEEDCGTYTRNEVSVHVGASATVYVKYDDTIPLSADSVLSFSFDKSVDIETVTTEIYSAKLLLMYLSYRRNVQMDDVELFTLDENRKQHTYGLIVSFWHEKLAPESLADAKKRIIQYQYLKDKTAALISLFGPSQQNGSSSIYVEHLCPSIKGTSQYTVARIISIFTAFDREFQEVYGQSYGRSDNYIEMLELAVDLVGRAAASKTGKSKDHLKEIQRALQLRKDDIPLSQRLSHALNDCASIMEPFVGKIVGKNIIEARDEFPQRMNTLRNDATHGNASFCITSIDASYIGIIELLLYVMWLKSIGIETESIKAALSDLFNACLHPTVKLPPQSQKNMDEGS